MSASKTTPNFPNFPNFNEIEAAAERLAASPCAAPISIVGAQISKTPTLGAADATLALELRKRIRNAPTPENPSAARLAERNAGDACLLAIWRKFESAAARNPARLQLSLSHTLDWVIAVGRVASEPSGTKANEAITGIGIDLEHREREIHDALRRKIVLPPEAELPLKLLELWVIKEACFKADPENSGRTVTDFEIKSFEAGSSSGTAVGRSSGTHFRYVLHRSEWLSAVALAARP